MERSVAVAVIAVLAEQVLSLENQHHAGVWPKPAVDISRVRSLSRQRIQVLPTEGLVEISRFFCAPTPRNRSDE